MLRGFYFDFQAEAPGPLLDAQEDVLAALRDLDRVAAEHALGYARFRDRFCHLDDGHASECVIEAVFGGVALSAATAVEMAS